MWHWRAREKRVRLARLRAREIGCARVTCRLPRFALYLGFALASFRMACAAARSCVRSYVFLLPIFVWKLPCLLELFSVLLARRSAADPLAPLIDLLIEPPTARTWSMAPWRSLRLV